MTLWALWMSAYLVTRERAPAADIPRAELRAA
jgi:hypothetical protein